MVENSVRKKVALGENTNGVGLENIRKRYQFLTDREVSIQETDQKFIVKLPIIEVEAK